MAAKKDIDADLVRQIKQAQREIKDELRDALDSAKLYKSKAKREAVYRAIRARYADLTAGLDATLAGAVATAAETTHERAISEMGATASVTQFSPARARLYVEMLNAQNAKTLAATFTDQMSKQAIRDLRLAFVTTFRQAALQGWTATETNKRFQAAWDKLAGNIIGDRFTDSAGRSWTNARYMQMLTRTTTATVTREAYLDTLRENGQRLALIPEDGDADCQFCAPWEGLIIDISDNPSGKFPTYNNALAAGVFHPNCTHSPRYIDETIDAKEIKRQSGTKNVDFEDRHEVQDYNNVITVDRYKADGLTEKQAVRQIKTDRTKRAAREGLFTGRYDDALDDMPELYDNMTIDDTPRFEFLKKGDKVDDPFNTNSSNGGVIHLDRKGTVREMREQMLDLQVKRGLEL